MGRRRGFLIAAHLLVQLMNQRAVNPNIKGRLVHQVNQRAVMATFGGGLVRHMHQPAVNPTFGGGLVHCVNHLAAVAARSRGQPRTGISEPMVERASATAAAAAGLVSEPGA